VVGNATDPVPVGGAVSEQIHGRVLTPPVTRVADATVIVVHGLAPVPDIARVSDEHGRYVFGRLPAGT
jgi:hypothetical protein